MEYFMTRRPRRNHSNDFKAKVAQYSGIFTMKDIGGSTEQGKKLYANYIC